MFSLKKQQLTIKHRPDFLMFGKEVKYPSEVPKEYQVRCSNVSPKNVLINLQLFHQCPHFNLCFFGRLQETKSLLKVEVCKSLKKQQSVFKEVKDNIKKVRIKSSKEKRRQAKMTIFRCEIEKNVGSLSSGWSITDSSTTFTNFDSQTCTSLHQTPSTSSQSPEPCDDAETCE